jgi:hypothetical protein
MNKETELYYIDIGYACFGIIVKNYMVIDAPPIARWMIGMHITRINAYKKIKIT